MLDLLLLLLLAAAASATLTSRARRGSRSSGAIDVPATSHVVQITTIIAVNATTLARTWTNRRASWWRAEIAAATADCLMALTGGPDPRREAGRWCSCPGAATNLELQRAPRHRVGRVPRGCSPSSSGRRIVPTGLCGLVVEL